MDNLCHTLVGAAIVRYVLRGRGYVKTLEDLEQSVIAVASGGVPIRLRDVATVQFGPEIRRGAADLNGVGEAVGGIVVMRIGSNALNVIRALENQIEQLSLPEGVRLIPTYDRSELILGSVATLRKTLIEEGIIVAIICLVFLMHARSALVVLIILPLSVLLSFIGIRYLGLSTNIMSLGGIAIAIGELSDAAIVLIESAHKRLAGNARPEDRVRVIIDSIAVQVALRTAVFVADAVVRFGIVWAAVALVGNRVGIGIGQGAAKGQLARLVGARVAGIRHAVVVGINELAEVRGMHQVEAVVIPHQAAWAVHFAKDLRFIRAAIAIDLRR